MRDGGRKGREESEGIQGKGAGNLKAGDWGIIKSSQYRSESRYLLCPRSTRAVTDCPADILSFVEVRGRRRDGGMAEGGEHRREGTGRGLRLFEVKHTSAFRPATLDDTAAADHAKSVTVNDDDDEMTSLSSSHPLRHYGPSNCGAGIATRRARVRVHRHLHRSNVASRVVHVQYIDVRVGPSVPEPPPSKNQRQSQEPSKIDDFF